MLEAISVKYDKKSYSRFLRIPIKYPDRANGGCAY